METLINNISQVLGITILHSLWQGLLVYLLLSIILSCLPSLSAAKKHNISLTAVAAIAVWFIATLANQATNVQWLAHEASATAVPLASFPAQHLFTHTAASDNNFYYTLKQYLPYVTVVYLVGLLLNILRLCFAWRNVSLVKQSLVPATLLEETVKTMCRQLNIKKDVLVSYSRLVDVPGVIGFFKPVLLLPLAITNNLSAAEVEAILLHELAHIKRNDYLLNVLQQVISVLLFFNPFALLINRIINTERENSCDDKVVQLTGQPLIYARALLTLEQSKQNNLQLVLAATGKKYSLLNRIERIMTAKKLTVNVRHILAVVLLFAFSAGSIAWLNPEIKPGGIKFKVVNPLLTGDLFGDTIPPVKAKKKKQYTVKQKTDKNGKKSTVIMESNDPELERLAKEVEKHGEAIGKFYESAEFKRLTADMERTGQDMDVYFNNSEIKRLEAQQDALAKQFSEKWENSAEMKKLSDEIEKSGQNIDTYYNNPEFKKLEKKLETESRLLDKAKPNSPDAERHMKNIREASKKISEYVRSPKIMQQQNLVKEMSEKIRQYYTSENFRTQQASLSRMSDSLRKAFDNPFFAAARNKMQVLSKQMQAYRNSPQIKAENERLQAATAKLKAYMNSPAYKKRMEQMQREIRIEIPERPEAPEKVEQPEAEAPDAPETPEPVEAPEAINN